jgi:hypothetical protein
VLAVVVPYPFFQGAENGFVEQAGLIRPAASDWIELDPGKRLNSARIVFRDKFLNAKLTTLLDFIRIQWSVVNAELREASV